MSRRGNAATTEGGLLEEKDEAAQPLLDVVDYKSGEEEDGEDGEDGLASDFRDGGGENDVDDVERQLHQRAGHRSAAAAAADNDGNGDDDDDDDDDGNDNGSRNKTRVSLSSSSLQPRGLSLIHI